jgi:hypothetical protein
MSINTILAVLLTINLPTLTLNPNNLLYSLLALLLMGGSRASNGWKGGFQ